MNSIMSQNLMVQPTKRFHLSFCRLLSYLPILQYPPPPLFLDPNNRHGHIQHDPLHFFNAYKQSTHQTISSTKVMHTHLLKTALFPSDMFVSNSLLDWYCKSRAVSDALKLFDTIPQPNVVSWNILVSGFNNEFLFEETWRLFCRMWASGFEPNEITYGGVLSACAVLGDTRLGEQVYCIAVRNGFYSNGFVRSGMIDLFAKNSTFEDALRVFEDLWCENVVCWNSIVSGAVRNGEHWVALDLFRQMCRGSIVPNTFTFSSILTACAALEETEIGKGIHAWTIKRRANDIFVGTAIVDLYAKCGDIAEAVKEFSRMPIRNVVSWTAILSGFVKKNDSISALNYFKEMKRVGEDINSFTLTTIITACAKPNMIRQAIQIHSWILKAGFGLDPVVAAGLINMYSKIGAIDLSEMVFREMGNVKSPATWNVMTSSLAQSHSSQRAIELLKRMFLEDLRPDTFCLSRILSVVDCVDLGRQIHCYTLKTGCIFDVSVGCSLFTMYSKCGSIDDSNKVFEQIVLKDSVSWTSMIAGLSEHSCEYQAFGLFRDMLSEGTRPDEMILNAILTACSGLRSLKRGKEVHGYALRAGLAGEELVGGSLVTVYSKCGALQLARKVFDLLPVKDQVSCSSVVSGYTQSGLLEEALSLFHEMLNSNVMVDSFTVSSVLGAIALLNRFKVGTQFHGHIVKLGLDSDVSVGSSLVTMYSKCGSLEDCSKAFEQINEPDLIGWTAMIYGYAQHGRGAEALGLYEKMRKEGIRPDAVTLVAVLTACSHANLVEHGYRHFNSITKDFGIVPNTRHYACMVDLLGRSGRLKEAEKFIKNMPIEPDALVWATLLAACKLHGDVELGTVAAGKVLELNPHDTGAYVLLSNIFADVGQWDEVLDIRSLMKGTGVRKEPGWSHM